MPYDSVYSSARTARCVPRGAILWRCVCNGRSVWLCGTGHTVCFRWLVCALWYRSAIHGLSTAPAFWSRYGEVSFFLGTDDLGRDVLSRLLSGAAPTVGGAFVVTLAATICGLVLGVLAGATHGLRSAVLNHILDTLLSIRRCCWRSLWWRLLAPI